MVGLPRWPARSRAREPIPIEEYTDPGSYVVRAQVPGLDPQREITVVIADNELTIEIRRPVHLHGAEDWGFHDEPVRRTILLPRGARDETVTATYDGDGILEVAVEMARPAPINRRVPIHVRDRRGGGGAES